MSDMKCPFCNQELKDQWLGQYVAHEYFDCPRCKMNGNRKLWQEFIRTRKVLEIAKERLKNTILDAEILATPEYLASRAKETLEQITALEQKDVK
jgi:phage FluMu protein Com